MEFKDELKKYQELVNSELEKYVRREDCYEKILNNSVEYSLMAGGKRLRAILVIDTYKLFKNDYETSLPFSMALEMIHNFSLIHDDLPEIDNDDFRHGKPTNHKAFNHATALLAGDALSNQAYITISNELKKQAENKNYYLLEREIKAFNEFSVAVDRMIAGEYLDTELEGKQISKELLQYIHENKTGALLKLSVRMGAILAEASEEGDQEIMGKPVGNDKELEKCTYVSYYGLEGAKQELNRIINEALEDLKIFGDKANFLRELTIYIRDRNK